MKLNLSAGIVTRSMLFCVVCVLAIDFSIGDVFCFQAFRSERLPRQRKIINRESRISDRGMACKLGRKKWQYVTVKGEVHPSSGLDWEVRREGKVIATSKSPYDWDVKFYDEEKIYVCQPEAMSQTKRFEVCLKHHDDCGNPLFVSGEFTTLGEITRVVDW